MEQSLVEPSMDDTLDALAAGPRRTLLVALNDHNPQDVAPTPASDSAEADDEMDRLVSMRHVHLPKLAEYGFVDWNERDHEVTKGPNFEEVRPFLELLDDHEDGLSPGWL